MFLQAGSIHVTPDASANLHFPSGSLRIGIFANAALETSVITEKADTQTDHETVISALIERSGSCFETPEFGNADTFRSRIKLT
jgi:hypothetical protein